MEYKGLVLDAFQEAAIGAIQAGRSVLVAAPTGAGKTLVAEYAVEEALRTDRKLIYTAPIKALSNQKYRDFQRAYGDRVGIVTGDVSINPRAPVLIMTTEIFRNEIFETPKRIEAVRWVVFDEVHYLDDDDRGTVWEESIIFAPPNVRLICLSATVPNLREMAAWIRTVRGEPIERIVESVRPVPLSHRLYVPTVGFVPFKKLNEVQRRCRDWKSLRRTGLRFDLDYLIDDLQDRRRLPMLYFAFRRRRCEELAAAQKRRELLSGPERDEAVSRFDALCEHFEIHSRTGTASALRAMVSRGVAYHHAGLLPTFKEIVERLYATGLIRLLFTTETFALGVNFPAASVVFDALEKFDGVRHNPLMTREYFQMAGRAGRRGMDTEGTVVGIVEPRFVDARKIQGTIHGAVEPVHSRFNLSYATILNVYDRLGEGIFEVADKSFAAFQDRKKGGRKKGGKKKRKKGAVGPSVLARHIERRLAVLEGLGYIEGRELLPRGRFAASSPGYEMQLTELLFDGVLEDVTADYLNVILTALVFEPRKMDYVTPLDGEVYLQVVTSAELSVARVRREERRNGVRPRVKVPNFGASRAVMQWCQGDSLESLRQVCSVDAGDLVRTFRMAIQFLRQIRAGSAVSPGLSAKVTEALALINRGVVDAEWQLRRDGEVLEHGA